MGLPRVMVAPCLGLWLPLLLMVCPLGMCLLCWAQSPLVGTLCLGVPAYLLFSALCVLWMGVAALVRLFAHAPSPPPTGKRE